MMFTATDLEDVAGEQVGLYSWAWMRRENIAVEAMQTMFAGVSRQWLKSDQDEDTVIDLCGQAFRLGWESHKGAS
jgi:hypothetical protein